ncbi:hypothetical protein CEUSTIGMA_g10866.t1 [Chlamydomonas eustigma]|uniref:Uncharacterized protein n=1 Tax=Chlamydomonas eustigma TaxID=1157962 RepID=A0A250XK25_9CHLO|nr:hypothetical protein CEUSTIGMA_g10866.t1 [Chlamydomonas eustigma]|eukprot:GAX83441.1 hypothetical protein CEUSTIGMA_g10866.t1 [Chlamydomonas eustigma]
MASSCLQSPAPRGLPKVPSLIFDLEMEEGAAAVHPSEDLDVSLVVEELQNFIAPSSREVVTLFEHVRDFVEEYANDDSSCISSAVLAEALTHKGYKVRIKHAVGGGEGSNCLHNLRHTYLSVSDGCNSIILVDPTFSEQFRIAKSTDRYSMLLACLPSVLVLPEERIVPLVTFLSAELTMAFKANDAVLPPWRMASSMLSKWQPRNSLDIPVSNGSAPVPLHGASGSENIENGRAIPLILDSKNGVGQKRPSESMGNPRQLKPQVFEPNRIYGGFGAMNMITG